MTWMKPVCQHAFDQLCHKTVLFVFDGNLPHGRPTVHRIFGEFGLPASFEPKGSGRIGRAGKELGQEEQIGAQKSPLVNNEFETALEELTRPDPGVVYGAETRRLRVLTLTPDTGFETGVATALSGL